MTSVSTNVTSIVGCAEEGKLCPRQEQAIFEVKSNILG